VKLTDRRKLPLWTFHVSRFVQFTKSGELCRTQTWPPGSVTPTRAEFGASPAEMIEELPAGSCAAANGAAAASIAARTVSLERLKGVVGFITA
jgi:hypothetical protein